MSPTYDKYKRQPLESCQKSAKHWHGRRLGSM